MEFAREAHEPTPERDSIPEAILPEASLQELHELYRVDATPHTDTSLSSETLVTHDAIQDEIATLEADMTAVGSLDTAPESVSTMTAQELRDRYDRAYRHDVAKSAWETRSKQRERLATAREHFSADAETAEIERLQAGVELSRRFDLEQLDQQLASLHIKTENSHSELDTEMRKKRQQVALRTPLEKVVAVGQKYFSFLGTDEAQAEIDTLAAQMQELTIQEVAEQARIQSEIERIQGEIKDEQQSVVERVKTNYQDLRTSNEASFVSERKNLLEQVRTKNQDSRLASEQTAELLAEGKLSVSELAKATNSLVIHSLPLEGWNTHNTSMNNTEIEADKVTIEEKIDIVTEKQPDLSVSIVSIDNPDAPHGTMYPFGLIIDGSVIASYGGDSSTIAREDRRYRKYVKVDGEGGTLQTDPVAEFKKNAQEAPEHGIYNETIVKKPTIKGIFLDGERLKPSIDTETGESHDYFGDTVVEYSDGTEESEAKLLEKYNGKDVVIARSTANVGNQAGKSIIRVTQKRSGEQKAIEFAQNNYPDLPIYIRRGTSVYDLSGQPVAAEDIYGT